MTIWRARLWMTVPLLLSFAASEAFGRERMWGLVAVLGFTWIFFQGFADVYVRFLRRRGLGVLGAESRMVPRWIVIAAISVSLFAALVCIALAFVAHVHG
jgi:hypothetical protein